MWSVKVVNGRKGQWALWIDRVLAVDDPESDDYQDFGQWRSEAQAFAAVDEIGDRFSGGERSFRFTDDFGGVVEVNGDDAYAADWAVAAPLLAEGID